MEITVIENERRKKEIDRPYRPETGEGSITGKRFCFHLPDAPIPIQYLPSFPDIIIGRNIIFSGKSIFFRHILYDFIIITPYDKYMR